jgi:steroid 5-alpha reductase family enzyme
VVADLLGLTAWTTGFLFEAVADAQLRRFRRNPANRDRVLSSGLWKWSRHPNYFGDALLWWGLFCFSLSGGDGWATAVSPMLMTFLLLRVSGITLLERDLSDRKPEYRAYVERTSAFVPLPPKRAPGPQTRSS